MAYDVMFIGGRRYRLPRVDDRRLRDVLLVLISAPLWMPLLLGLMILSRIMQGPGVIYVQPRLGRHGQVFSMFKLRTMVRDADQRLGQALAGDNAALWARQAKLPDDPRCTPLGRWLRRHSLDELPQVLNVLRGDMALIGPRPVPAREFQQYYTGVAAEFYLSVRPGLSGLWQVTGRNGPYDRRLMTDAYYARRRGPWLDLWILLRTLLAVFKGTGR